MINQLRLKTVSTVIKGLSIILIGVALGLELCDLWGQLPDRWQWGLKIMQFVLIAHGIEGAIAAVWVRGSAHQAQPLRYGLYTFFVGFPGLLELWVPPEKMS